jgi:hypothetical protein
MRNRRRRSVAFVFQEEHLLPTRIAPSDVGGAAQVLPDIPRNPFAPGPNDPPPPKIRILPDGSYLMPGSRFIHAKPLDGRSYPELPTPLPTPIPPPSPTPTPIIPGKFIQGPGLRTAL